VSCRIQDISYEGARIVLFYPIDIPDEIKLSIPEKDRMVRANVRWRHDNKIGLAFSDELPDVTKRWAIERAAIKAEVGQAKETVDLLRMAHAVTRLDALDAEIEAVKKATGKSKTAQG
jgi:hypothetical protein